MKKYVNFCVVWIEKNKGKVYVFNIGFVFVKGKLILSNDVDMVLELDVLNRYVNYFICFGVRYIVVVIVNMDV